VLFPPAPSPTNSAHRAILCASLVLLQPTLLAQSSLVSPDVLLVCFFCAVLVIFVRRRHENWRGLYALALTLLAFTSLRGVIAIGALFCAECVLLWLNKPTTTSFDVQPRYSAMYTLVFASSRIIPCVVRLAPGNNGCDWLAQSAIHRILPLTQ
jgi:predicted membrane-bound mannosyltransferase